MQRCRLQLAAFLVLSFASLPAMANSLSFGPFNQGVYSGSTPFNTTGTCTDPGDDCADNDLRVRSADLISYAWSVAASGIPAGSPDFESVILEQTITPGPNADIIFNEIPTACLAPPFGSGGTNPSSSITQNPDGSTTLLCNMGSMGNGDQSSFTVPVRPLASSYDGSTFTTSQLVYALDAAGSKIVFDTPYADPNSYSISAAPAWDLIGNNRPVYKAGVTSNDVGTGRGVEQGFYLYTTVALGADADRAGKGMSQLTNSFAFDSIMTATASDGVTPYPLEYKIVQCIPNPSGWGNSVWGNEAIVPSAPLEEHVVDSGTCNITGSATAGWQMTVNNADTTGSRYPTQRVNNSSLAAGPYFAMSHRVMIFVPFSEIEREDSTNLSGAINVSQCFDNFDPNDTVGISNYGGLFEPGANGTAMPSGAASNNCSGPVTLEIKAQGTFNQRVGSTANNGGGIVYSPLVSTYHAGDGRIEPGIGFPHYSYVGNTGNVDLHNAQVCVAFDNTTQKLTDRSAVGASAGTYAYPVGFGGAVSSDWIVEYANAPITNDDPLDADGDGVADFNAVSGRYEGDWSELSAQSNNCDDASLSWNADPTVVGLDNVNLVRVRAINPATVLGAGQNIRLITPVEARDIFNGGPYAGTPLPVGVVMPGYGSYRTDEIYPTWLAQGYLPSPENSSARGDRMTFTRVTIDVAKSTVSPAAPAGTATSTLAGNSVVWELQPVISSTLAAGTNAVNAVVTDVLPSELTYDQTCTLGATGGTPPTSVLYNTPSAGQTTLSWSLGSPSSQVTPDPIIFCTQTDATAPAGTSVANAAYIDADNALISNTAFQSITLGQAGSLQSAATVDVPSDLKNDTQVHTLKWYNFSNAGTVAPPTVVNVLPHAGDGTSASDRAPASVFSGTLALLGEPTVTFADGSLPAGGDPFADIGTLYYTNDPSAGIQHDPDTNTSNWCEYDGTNFINPSVTGGACATAFSDVTGIKHVSNYSLQANGDPRQGLIMTYTVQANGNSASDRYVNIFGVDSTSLPPAQFVKSKRSIVTIVSYSIGDWIFVDMNGNGIYDPAVDLPAPDGITVELRDFNTNALVDSTTTVNGAYLFAGLDEGDYYVQIPANLFASGGGLFDWNEAPNGQSANTDDNHTVDHNAMVTGSTMSNGVQTDKITLSAQPGTPGQAPTGDEPTGDNIIPVPDYTTNDDFSNLTVDLGLVSGDADNDGIPDVYEFGPGGIGNFQDTDGDGFPDYLDVDSDNDGVPDAIEFGGDPAALVDTDGDGTPDHLDIDSDNDGIPDSNEAGSSGLDTDADGVPDEYDIDITGGADSDGNGLDDAVEAAGLLDTDGDGIADLLDLDSDNDGLTDTHEAGGVDSDGDGIVDGFTDNDGDGMDDATFAAPLPVDDTDGDGAADHLDIDADNDGINDVVEAGGVDSDNDGVVDGFVDTDGDGLDDTTQATPLADPDTDGDGIVDHLDVDSDNDGIPDAIEGNVDTDGDGIPDYLDLDSDNDGVLDSVEAPLSGVDTDGDGIDDMYDVDATGGVDANGDGIDDAVAAAGVLDTDGDGTPDYLDLDSDNDGINDVIEAGGADADNDGVVDGFTDANGDGLDDNTLTTALPDTDTDGDGVSDRLDVDSDNDGIPDVIEGTVDSDGDGIPDFLDQDSDNDGLPDALEAGTGVDTDGDGIDDLYDVDSTGGTDANGDGIDDAVSVLDTDGDGIPDYLDIDSDNDGINDVIEAGGVDADNDGVVDGFVDTDGNGIDDATQSTPLPDPDTDGDGIVDHLDVDSDNDGIPDSVEGNIDTDGDGIPDYLDIDSDNDGIPDAIEGNVDTDGDGIPDYLDMDSDNDGIPDALEAPISGVDTDGDGIDDLYDVDATGGVDADGDGIDDAVEAAGVLDTDGDGTPDYLDLDADNDGILDSVEAPISGVDTDGDGIDDLYDVDATGGVDADGDGIDDAVAAAGVLDTDGDGTPDYLDLDSDNDGINDVIEAGGVDADNDGVVDGFVDTDGNGVNDGVDAVALTDPDTDGDGIVDHLDVDSDNDGIPDSVEGNIDTDGDGTPDYLDQDSDNDGIPDSVEGTIDTDGDGTPNYQDEDSDNDGIPDAIESAVDSDGDGTPDYLDQDSDSDGIPDATEGNIDTDSDGSPDYLDLDSDDDGITDVIESGGADADNDGIADNLDLDSDNDGIPDTIEGNVDTDGDGIPDYLDEDSDNDGIPDSYEAGATPGNPVDTDGDGVPDYLDLDSDNDGLSDSIESGDDPTNPVDSDGDGSPDHLDLDSDGDNVPDSIEGLTDADGDGVSDYLDLDSDNDGLSDALEGTADTDGDGIADYLDEDSDNDGIADSVEAEFEGSIPADKDNDGTPDYLDVDADNDGISDMTEGSGDRDADGVENFRDLDVDNDGILDIIEARIGMVEVNQLDTDLDGVIDTSNNYGINGMADIVQTAPESGVENYTLVDIDGDGVVDYRDLDSDNDGLLDTIESDHEDTDLNGIIDQEDTQNQQYDYRAGGANFAPVVNAAGLASGAGGAPRNTDQDGLADFRDLDSDNDGIVDIVEAFGPEFDVDNDGVLDGFVDDDGDGVSENFLPTSPFDSDGDGIYDALELDSDNDGINDLVETGGVDADGDGMIDGFQDLDGNGVDDGIQIIASSLIDADGNGIPDYRESAPVLAQAVDGIIHTGLSGGVSSGCSVASTNTRIDPTLLVLVMLSLVMLIRRRRLQCRVLLASATAAFLSGCSLLGQSSTDAPDLKTAQQVEKPAAIVQIKTDTQSRAEQPLAMQRVAYSEGHTNDAHRFRKHVYVGAGLGLSRLEPDTSEVSNTDVNDRVEGGGQLSVGWDYSKWFSLELHSADLGSAGISSGGRINYHLLGGSALFYAGKNRHSHSRRGLSGFGRLGYGFLQNSPVGDVNFKKDHSTHVLAGAGVEYTSRIGFGLRAEYIYYEEDIQYGQLGLLYRFGRSHKQRPVVQVVKNVPVVAPVAAVAIAPLDTDSDGVLDNIDQCPSTAIDLSVGSDGCALFAGVIEGVNFNNNSAELTPDAQVILDAVAITLRKYPSASVDVKAHTDSNGSKDWNQGLSERRAVSVVEYLVGNGIAKPRLIPSAYGETKPIDTNETREGRLRNRRVELYAKSALQRAQ